MQHGDDRRDRHPPLEADRDERHDHDHEDHQGTRRLGGDVGSPGGADHVETDVVGVDPGGRGEGTAEPIGGLGVERCDLDLDEASRLGLARLDPGTVDLDALVTQDPFGIVHVELGRRDVPRRAASEVDPEVETPGAE